MLVMKTITRTTASLSPFGRLQWVPLAVISSLLVTHRFGRIRSLLLRSLFAIGLVATAATSALAGSGGFSATGSLNVARYGHIATLLVDGQVLVVGGVNDSTGYLSSAELYNPSTGKWTLTGSLNTARYGHNMVRLQSGQVLVAGGTDPTACCGAPPLATAELYNPSTGTWTATGSMMTGRDDFIMALLPNGEVLAAGGDNGNGTFFSSAELYNPATGTWTATTNMINTDLGALSIAIQNGQVFVSENLNLYTPSTATWTVVTNAPSGHGVGPLVLLPNDNVFVGGGGVFGDDIVNPPINQWTNIAPAPCTSRSQSCESASVLLNTGKILVAGGITTVHARPYDLHETNGLAALLDLSTLTWASTGSMSKSRIAETATVLPNGQVLFAGGETFDKHLGHLVPIASAELYTP
jgi:Kelch motif protein